MIGPLYRVTDSGRNVWETQDPSVPADYRMILWMIDFHGDQHLIHLAQRFPKELLEDNLRELEELRLIEPMAVGDTRPSDTKVPLVSLSVDDAAAASRSLSHYGAYLAEGRLNRQSPASKSLSETVVLIVEDDPDQLALADLRVSMAGYAVRVARSQAELHQSLAKEGVPDLLLLDVMLPDGNGFEILSRLRSLPAFATLPIVLLTAKNEPGDIDRGLKLGADGYITKPYSKTVFATLVANVLAGGSTPRTPT